MMRTYHGNAPMPAHHSPSLWCINVSTQVASVPGIRQIRNMVKRYNNMLNQNNRPNHKHADGESLINLGMAARAGARMPRPWVDAALEKKQPGTPALWLR